MSTTDLVAEVKQRKPGASDRLMSLAYGELRELAARYLREERAGHTLQATALVHEAYLRLVDQTRADWRDRTHFVAVAALAMRRILVDHARASGAAKRRGGGVRLTLSDSLGLAAKEVGGVDVLALDEAMERLATLDARHARIVELRFFGGLTIEETAGVLDVATSTVEEGWKVARAWLRRELMQEDG